MLTLVEVRGTAFVRLSPSTLWILGTEPRLSGSAASALPAEQPCPLLSGIVLLSVFAFCVLYIFSCKYSFENKHSVYLHPATQKGWCFLHTCNASSLSLLEAELTWFSVSHLQLRGLCYWGCIASELYPGKYLSSHLSPHVVPMVADQRSQSVLANQVSCLGFINLCHQPEGWAGWVTVTSFCCSRASGSCCLEPLSLKGLYVPAIALACIL